VKTLFLELSKHRALILALSERSIALRYRGSSLGFLWSILNPLCLMLVYTLVFRYYIRFDQVEHYSIFLFCGLLPWIWFSSGLAEGTQSIASSGHLITKALFPAQVLPAVAIISTAVNFCLSLPVLILFLLFAQVPINLSWLALPLLMTVQSLLMFGLVLGLASLNVRYRDVQHILANGLTFLFFLSPIIYPLSSIPEKFRIIIYFNPSGLLTCLYHDILYSGVFPQLDVLIATIVWTLIALVWGNYLYQTNRERFAEWL